MAGKMRWGIMGCGRIAGQLAGALAISETSELYAVASRGLDKAQEFGNRWGAAKAYGSYEELVSDPNVDAIYVATIHPVHPECSILAANHGKHVLCEKPMAMSAAKVETMIAAARKNKVFLMEAMWTRFLPNIVHLRKLIAEGAIGEVRMVTADFGFRGGWDPEGRQLDPKLGGGALLDMGIYPLSLASMLLGKPEQVTGVADVGKTGVDEQFIAAIRYSEGRLAAVSGAVRTSTHREAWVIGTEGQILLEPGWWGGSKLVMTRPYRREAIDFDFASNCYVYQVDELARCVAAGKLESDAMPLDETLELARTMDTLLRLWGVKYPGDTK